METGKTAKKNLHILQRKNARYRTSKVLHAREVRKRTSIIRWCLLHIRTEFVAFYVLSLSVIRFCLHQDLILGELTGYCTTTTTTTTTCYFYYYFYYYRIRKNYSDQHNDETSDALGDARRAQGRVRRASPVRVARDDKTAMGRRTLCIATHPGAAIQTLFWDCNRNEWQRQLRDRRVRQPREPVRRHSTQRGV